MENTSMNKTTYDFTHGNDKMKTSISLKELVMEALLRASSNGMVVSEIYAFVNSRCKEYDLAESKWKINVRNMLTTSVYFQCFPRKERDGRRGRCWKFNIDAYNLHLQLKGNRESSASIPNEDNRRNLIIGEVPTADPSSTINNFSACSFDGMASIRPQPFQMSLMHNQFAYHPVQMQQTHSSNGTDFTNTARANPVDRSPHHNVSLQQIHISADSVNTSRRSYVNRFVPYDLRDSRTYTHLTNAISVPGHNQDLCITREYSHQPSRQSHSAASMNSDTFHTNSFWMAQAHPPVFAGFSYLPQEFQTQLRSTDPYQFVME